MKDPDCSPKLCLEEIRCLKYASLGKNGGEQVCIKTISGGRLLGRVDWILIMVHCPEWEVSEYSLDGTDGRFTPWIMAKLELMKCDQIRPYWGNFVLVKCVFLYH